VRLSNFNPDCYTDRYCDPDIHTYSDANCYSHGNAYSDRHIHCNGDSNRYPHPDAYANAMHGEMYTDTEASPNPAPASNTASQVARSRIVFANSPLET
jgi:hypothetical protein